MSSWHSYSEIYTLGHRALENLFQGKVSIEEKIDGSQFNFGLIDGELKIKSKGAKLFVDNPERLFEKGILEVAKRECSLTPNWTYRGEFLRAPRHNALKYNRVPNNHIIIFDIAIAEETYLNYEDKKKEAERLGFECTPLLFEGEVKNTEQLLDFLKIPPLLGGPYIEGFVVKNYTLFNHHKKILIGKTVNDEFKEVMSKTWKASNLPKKDFVIALAEKYKTEARWNKAIQHLRDTNSLDNSMKDIGPLLKEISTDVLKECKEDIQDALFDHFWHEMNRIIIKGFPEHFKKYLANNQQF